VNDVSEALVVVLFGTILALWTTFGVVGALPPNSEAFFYAVVCSVAWSAGRYVARRVEEGLKRRRLRVRPLFPPTPGPLWETRRPTAGGGSAR
jgi:hypothetical protein